jgi:hypothetical protein
MGNKIEWASYSVQGTLTWAGVLAARAAGDRLECISYEAGGGCRLLTVVTWGVQDPTHCYAADQNNRLIRLRKSGGGFFLEMPQEYTRRQRRQRGLLMRQDAANGPEASSIRVVREAVMGAPEALAFAPVHEWMRRRPERMVLLLLALLEIAVLLARPRAWAVSAGLALAAGMLAAAWVFWLRRG